MAETDPQTFHAVLNAKDIVQPGWYHRNHIAYELVCYVNNIVGLYLSGNYPAIPVLLDRAHGYLNRDDKAQLNDQYRENVMSYLAAVAKVIAADGSLSERDRGLIPKELLG